MAAFGFHGFQSDSDRITGFTAARHCQLARAAGLCFFPQIATVAFVGVVFLGDDGLPGI